MPSVVVFLKKNNMTSHVCSDSKHHQDLKHSDWVNHFYKNDMKSFKNYGKAYKG